MVDFKAIGKTEPESIVQPAELGTQQAITRQCLRASAIMRQIIDNVFSEKATTTFFRQRDNISTFFSDKRKMYAPNFLPTVV